MKVRVIAQNFTAELSTLLTKLKEEIRVFFVFHQTIADKDENSGRLSSLLHH